MPEIWNVIGDVIWDGFQHVISATPMTVVLITVLLLARRLFMRKIAPKVWHALWIFCLLRIMIPWPPIAEIHVPFLHADILRNTEIQEQIEVAAATLQPSVATQTEERHVSNNVSIKTVQPTFTTSALQVACAIWLAGVLCLSLLHVTVHLYWRNRLRLAVNQPIEALEPCLVSCKQILGIRSSVTLLQSSAVNIPTIYGIWRPTILIPAHMAKHFTETEWKSILLHELAHHRRRDFIWNVLLTAITILHWFNPLMWKANQAMREDEELSCDAAALQHVERKTYGSTLLKTANMLHSNRMVSFPTFAGQPNFMQRRMEMIINSTKQRSLIVTISLLILIMLLAATSISIAAGNKDQALPFQLPAEGKLNEKSPYTSHQGVTIGNAIGTPVYAAADGTVLVADYSGKLGFYILIEHEDGYQTEYGNLQELQVEPGQSVKKGEQIALLGQTGSTTGPRLYFGLMKNGQYIHPEQYSEYMKLDEEKPSGK